MQTTPFWREAAELDPGDAGAPPQRVEVAVIGGGFTGLAAAAETAAAGRETLVLEAGELGAGASTRNGGMIGWGHRAKLDDLSRRYGAEAATAILGEAKASYEHALGLIEEMRARHGVDARFRRSGRFLGAASPAIYERLARDVTALAPKLGFEAAVVPRAEQGGEIASAAYFGGVVFPSHGMLHPGLFHRGLVARARAAGVKLYAGAAVRAIARTPAGGWRLETDKGAVEAADLALATNGYSGKVSTALGAFARRVIPLPSYMVATERLGANRLGALMPGGRSYVDTRSTHSYFRADPDGERILWGGRASLRVIPIEQAAKRLSAHMASVFPEMRGVALTHAWSGHIAYTEDVIPHVGRFADGPLAGAAYAGGYCGSGVAMAPWLGRRMGRLVLGEPDAAGPFAAARFRPVPAAWGLGPALRVIEAWHRFGDWRAGAR